MRALSSLRRQDATTIADAVANIGAGWSETSCDDYDGYLTILIEPTEQAATQSSYLIFGTIHRVELGELRGDDMTTLSVGAAVPAMVEHLTQILQAEGNGPSARAA